MASTSLYNRWRPRTFADRDDHPLIGQEHVTRTLRNAVASGQIAHAYLFCGPRGTGKTSAARILARAVNCRRGLHGEACNQCENCTALLSGRQLDLLIEIDGASNRGVDDVRQLRERIMQRPGGAGLTGQYKVYIVDEVHMLTPEAFNALLKSLEEPPPHVIFVLATTDPQKVPATVVSRCQRFDFKPIPLETLARHLAHVAAAEGVQIEAAGIELLARSAAGGARDAVSLLDQALTFAGASPAEGDAAPATRVVTAAQIQAMLGLTDFDAVCRLIDAVVARDTTAGLRAVQEVAAKGTDLRQLSRQLLEFLRAMLLCAGGAPDLVQLDDETRDAVVTRANRAPMGEIVRLIKLFTQAEAGLKSPAVQPQLPLELAVVEASIGPHTPDVDRTVAAEPVAGRGQAVHRAPPAGKEQVVRREPVAAGEPAAERHEAIEATDDGAGQGAPEEAPAEAPALAAGARPRGRAATHAEPREQPEESEAPTQDGAGAAEGAHPVDGGRAAEEAYAIEEAQAVEKARATRKGGDGVPGDAAVTVDEVREKWPRVLDAIHQTRNRSLEALLRDAEPGSVEAGNVVVLHFRYSFHASKVRDPSNLVLVQRALSRALGVRATVRCEVTEGAGSRADRTRSPAAPDDPVVGKALRMLNARVMTPAELAAVDALPVATDIEVSEL